MISSKQERTLHLLRLFLFAMAAGVLAYGASEVWRHRWLCDDAFISFRYAQNLVRGHGLVFNVGERVEGYTNFLWTIIIAFFMTLGVCPERSSMLLGALSHLATASLLGWLSWRTLGRDARETRLFLPVSALAILLHHDCQVFATGGLETSWVSFLVLCGYSLLLAGQRRLSALWAGVALVLASASRPDALLFYAMGVVFLALSGKKQHRSAMLYLSPLIAMYLPYWVARYLYYGYPFPNTYYAKSANLPYYSQGLRYLSLYVQSYYVLLLLPLALVAVLATRLRSAIVLGARGPMRALILAVLFAAPYAIYVVRAGGDFMFARLFIPVTPLLFFALEISVHMLWKGKWVRLAAGTAILFGVFFRWDPYTERNLIHYVANEPAFYSPSWRGRAKQVGERMREYFRGTDTRIAFGGTHAAFIYYAEPAVGIESHTGLTDVFVAHQTISKRGWPGHEKPAPQAYLVSRGVNFAFMETVPSDAPTDAIRLIEFGDFRAQIVVYKRETMERLRQYPEISFTYLPAVLDDYIRQLGAFPEESIRSWYQFFREYYFDHNEDPVRQKAFLDRLGEPATAMP